MVMTVNHFSAFTCQNYYLLDTHLFHLAKGQGSTGFFINGNVLGVYSNLAQTSSTYVYGLSDVTLDVAVHFKLYHI